MADMKKELGQRIRSLRTSRRLTQDELAEKAELSPKHLGKIERGSVNVSIDCVASIAKALNMPVRDILEAEHERNREELLAELTAYLPELSLKDMQIVYRLVKTLSGR